jgi:hypothetical protein
MTRYKIIVNPITGLGAGDRAAPQIEAPLSGHGLDFDLVCTKHAWHAADLAREAVADGYDRVVAEDSGWSSSYCRARLRSFQPGSVAGLCPWRGR